MSEEYSARLERLLAFTESKTSELNNSGWKEFTSSILRGSIAREKARDEADSLATSIWSKLNQGKPHLNSDQQVVLNVLKKNANQGLDELIVGGITYMTDKEIDAIELSQQEELYQVLAAFAEWGMKQC